MPKFSVIIPSVNGLPTLAECLTALEKQQCGFDYEIIVADRTGDETVRFIREKFPRVKLITLGSACGIPELRFTAFLKASGEFLAVTEDHCLVPKDWLARLYEGHQKGFQVIGGAVENVSRKRLTDWAVFLCEYSSFMPPLVNGEVEYVTGNNTSYQRSALEQLDHSLLKDYWEYFINADLKQRGARFFSIGSLTIDHKKSFGIVYFLKQRFQYSRSFAAMRNRRTDFLKKLLYLFYAPILPIHQTWKLFQNICRKKRNLREFMLSLPLIIFFMVSYALGEVTGSLFGSGKSLSKVE